MKSRCAITLSVRMCRLHEDNVNTYLNRHLFHKGVPYQKRYAYSGPFCSNKVYKNIPLAVGIMVDSEI